MTNDELLRALQLRSDESADAIKALTGRLDVMDQLNTSFNTKLADHDATVVAAENSLRIIEEMRGDVALCKAGIKDLDSIRDSYGKAAQGFNERLSVMEESFAAFQTLRHHEDDPRPTPTTVVPSPADADPGGAPAVDSMK